MAKIYASLIVAGRKTFEEVPTQIKDEVKLALKEYVVRGELTAEQYQEFVGEPYVG
jgi:hypothetical protein